MTEDFTISRLASHRTRNGFTLVELLVVMPIIVIVLATIFTFMITLYTGSLQSVNRLQSVNDVNDALDTMRVDVETSASPSPGLTSGVIDAYGPPEGGSWATNGKWEDNTTPAFSRVILKMPVTTASAQVGTREYVRINQNGCTGAALYSNPVYYYNVIYFVYQNTLYKRSVINPTPPALCGASNQIATCPVYTAATGCTKDTIILKDVTTFEVRFEIPAQGYHPNTYCPAPDTSRSSEEDDDATCIIVNGPTNAKVLTFIAGVTRSTGDKTYSYSHRFTVAPLSRLTN